MDLSVSSSQPPATLYAGPLHKPPRSPATKKLKASVKDSSPQEEAKQETPAFIKPQPTERASLVKLESSMADSKEEQPLRTVQQRIRRVVEEKK